MRNLLLLHVVVLILGFTGILGKLITIDAEPLVWYRMLIATISIGLYLLLKTKSLLMSKKGAVATILTGFIIAAHWIFFFEAIKLIDLRNKTIESKVFADNWATYF